MILMAPREPIIAPIASILTVGDLTCLLDVDQSRGPTAAKRWRMAIDPRQASIIEAIATGICVGLVAYLAYLVFSFLATA